MKEKIRKYLVTLSGILLGVIGGFIYWKYAGCTSGTCPITSSWKIMLIYGGLMGGLSGNMIQDWTNKNRTKKQNINAGSTE